MLRISLDPYIFSKKHTVFSNDIICFSIMNKSLTVVNISSIWLCDPMFLMIGVFRFLVFGFGKYFIFWRCSGWWYGYAGNVSFIRCFWGYIIALLCKLSSDERYWLAVESFAGLEHWIGRSLIVCGNLSTNVKSWLVACLNIRFKCHSLVYL